MTTLPDTTQDMIVPVILCGGSGTRLWPASRENHPKQFLSLLGDLSLLQNTLRRALRVSGASASSVVVVTLDAMEKPVRDQLAEIDPAAATHILREPCVRNTAAAIAFAADYIAKTFGENAIMWVLPADHHIGRESALAVSFQSALRAAKDGRLATFGISPTRPDTGYGYIRIAQTHAEGDIHTADSFVEKPDHETAHSYLESGNYLWNSGMFVFSAREALEQYKSHAASILETVRAAMVLSAKEPDLNIYKKIPSLPFDKAIMEKSGNIAVVPCDPQWSDIGSWESLWTVSAKDSNGNVIDGNAVVHNAEGCLIQSNDRLIAVSGINDIVVVETEDAVLVTNKNDTDSMKDLVTALKKSGAREVMDLPASSPAPQSWTMVKQLGDNSPLHAREITLAPGQHKMFESDGADMYLYTVVEGTADITVNGKLKTLQAFESLNVRASAPYTITNHGAAALKMIEVRKTAAEGIFFGTAGQNRKVA